MIITKESRDKRYTEISAHRNNSRVDSSVKLNPQNLQILWEEVNRGISTRLTRLITELSDITGSDGNWESTDNLSLDVY